MREPRDSRVVLVAWREPSSQCEPDLLTVGAWHLATLSSASLLAERHPGSLRCGMNDDRYPPCDEPR